MSFNWKTLVKTIAPTIGTALGGPVGGVATKFLADKFLGKPDASTQELEAAIIGATPEQLASLKKLDNDFKVQMQQLDIDVFKLEVDDRKSARELFKTSIWPQVTLSACFVVGYFAVLWVLMTGDALSSMENQALFGVFTTIIGVLTAAVPQILGFWFGSSLGSKEKTAATKSR